MLKSSLFSDPYLRVFCHSPHNVTWSDKVVNKVGDFDKKRLYLVPIPVTRFEANRLPIK